MKSSFKVLLCLIALVTLSSCSTIQVATDYDSQVNFDQYKTFAFYKPGIDQAETDASEIPRQTAG